MKTTIFFIKNCNPDQFYKHFVNIFIVVIIIAVLLASIVTARYVHPTLAFTSKDRAYLGGALGGTLIKDRK